MSTASVYLAGATASGKSALAMRLAKRLGGEIISVDSMQVYRGLDIGTAKPSAADQGEVRHYLIDVAGLDEPFDVAQFVCLAKRAEEEVRSRGARPIFCGGTGLYFRALFDGLGESPPGDESLRAELEAAPLESLLDELAARDPAAFESVDRQNRRRVVRAVEVIRLTGRTYSSQRTGWAGPSQAPENLFCVTHDPGDLAKRIHSRVDAMFERGLIAETERLAKRGLRDNRPARQALGYRQALEHLDGGPGVAETVELVKSRTRQFAKRQRTWFRNQMDCQLLEWPTGKAEEACCERLLGMLG
ncbi:MAG: tRNA (adenosine(37)-N6)-dimethylallyltransferase MiaA [Verrucomicrobiota bacterium]|nr:tRNA (adenosine(37)-N6)-dimethylallyltransferase MiaA [Verrucomicrobiota bacterium]MDP7050150.1 tRNA (adenosine(37)-N6)-dimethylallyltransferase MiaA [Verrucomicrobiota bacterium]